METDPGRQRNVAVWRFHYPAQACVQVHAMSRRLLTQPPVQSLKVPCYTANVSSDCHFSIAALQETASLTLCLQPNVKPKSDLKVPKPHPCDSRLKRSQTACLALFTACHKKKTLSFSFLLKLMLWWIFHMFRRNTKTRCSQRLQVLPLTWGRY